VDVLVVDFLVISTIIPPGNRDAPRISNVQRLPASLVLTQYSY
jgi:hypothetical protein